MTSAEEGWSFPDTLEGFGYTFNTGNRNINFLKIKAMHRWICEIEDEFPTPVSELWPFYVGTVWLDLASTNLPM
jgi:hypothetical protein